MPHIGKWPTSDGEFERLRGGFGGAFAWTALVLSIVLGLPTALFALASLLAGEGAGGLCCGSFAATMAVFGLWPLLRSSSYILTNRRLLVTSRFGSTIAIPLSRIDRAGITVDPLTSSLTLRGEQSAALRYIGGCRQLWSLLLLPARHEAVDAEIVPDETAAAQSAPAPSHQERGEHAPKRTEPPAEPVECIYWNALRIDGLKTQKGIAILREDYFAFLPTTAARHLVGMTAGAAAGVLGVHPIRLESKVPFEVLLGHLSQCDAATFDAEMGRLTEEFDALVWQHGEAVVERQTKNIPFQGRYVAQVHDRTTCVHGSLRRDQLPTFQRLSSLWPEVPDFEYRSAGTIVFLAFLLLFLTAFAGCAIYFSIVEPNALGTIATGLITVLTLVGWFGWARMLLPKWEAAFHPNVLESKDGRP